MFELQSPNLKYINEKGDRPIEVGGYLICTFSNPLVGGIKSKASFHLPFNGKPDMINDNLMKQYWNMSAFHEGWHTQFEKKYSLLNY